MVKNSQRYPRLAKCGLLNHFDELIDQLMQEPELEWAKLSLTDEQKTLFFDGIKHAALYNIEKDVSFHSSEVSEHNSRVLWLFIAGMLIIFGELQELNVSNEQITVFLKHPLRSFWGNTKNLMEIEYDSGKQYSIQDEDFKNCFVGYASRWYKSPFRYTPLMFFFESCMCGLWIILGLSFLLPILLTCELGNFFKRTLQRIENKKK